MPVAIERGHRGTSPPFTSEGGGHTFWTKKEENEKMKKGNEKKKEGKWGRKLA